MTRNERWWTEEESRGRSLKSVQLSNNCQMRSPCCKHAALLHRSFEEGQSTSFQTTLHEIPAGSEFLQTRSALTQFDPARQSCVPSWFPECTDIQFDYGLRIRRSNGRLLSMTSAFAARCCNTSCSQPSLNVNLTSGCQVKQTSNEDSRRGEGLPHILERRGPRLRAPVALNPDEPRWTPTRPRIARG